ncbi:NAD(P)-binding protein [Auriculariales sp. MPI-PUGE-AT-0066]|nr:NAD(P)-binding protein [Auriculariales sp. MPI-PUGE-AT-0066]
MRAVVVDKDMTHLELTVSDAPEPKVGPNDVLVDVYSSAVNFFDTLMAQGKYQIKQKHPFVLGTEFAGRINQSSPLPKGCPFKHGDRVFGSNLAAYAERVAVPWKLLHPVPANLTMEQAAGVSLTYPTSYEGIVGRGELKPGEWVLVHAGADFEGTGGKVIATAGSEEKREVCKRLGGADHVIDYNNKDWTKEVLKLTDGKGVDIVFDPVGLIRESLKCIAWKGRAVVVGFTGGAIENLPLNVVLLKNVAVTGLHWGAYTKFEQSRIPIVWKELYNLIKSGKIVPSVYEHVYEGLDQVPEAIEAVTKRRTYGKAIVRLRRDPESAKL